MIDPLRMNQVSTDRVVELARQAKCLHEPWVQRFIRGVAHSDNPALEQDFALFLRHRAIDEVLRDIPFTNPTPLQLQEFLQTEHPVLFGLIADLGTPFVQPIDWLSQHSIVFGGSGTGKTNLLYSLGSQVMRGGRTMIAIERNKTDMRHLRRLFPDLLVFNTRNFPHTLLQVPDGVDPRLFAADVVEVFCKSHGLLDLSEGLAQSTLLSLFERFGILDGGCNWPTFFDWRQEIAALRIPRWDRRSGPRDSLLVRFDSYLQLMPELSANQQGPSVSELCEHSFVWELTHESERQTRFLTSLFLKSLYRTRIANNERTSSLRTLVIFDECKAAFPPGPDDRTGYAPLAAILATSREIGLGLCLADQTAQLNDACFVQTRNKISLRLGSGEDIRKIGRTFGLTEEQARFIPRLDVGQAIVRVPGIAEPFLIKIPRTRIQ